MWSLVFSVAKNEEFYFLVQRIIGLKSECVGIRCSQFLGLSDQFEISLFLSSSPNNFLKFFIRTPATQYSESTHSPLKNGTKIQETDWNCISLSHPVQSRFDCRMVLLSLSSRLENVQWNQFLRSHQLQL